ncbi:GerA spore germination protein [Caldalkalibacillus thermarum TA2.A1]|uniref:GerA spore germination protein n=1 Tax=Caldalkalibacillus thermarum (strain TA2.A1) TaxID=986075 RepID=F5L8B5_CALTT|nr:GerA spore germination protein [Caldalkalibacillus thermarum TA2.A1]
MVRRWRKWLSKADEHKTKALEEKIKRNPHLNKQELHTPLSASLTDNEQVLRSLYKNCYDVIFRSFFISGKTKAMLIYIEGMSNVEELNDNLLAPLMKEEAGQPHSMHSIQELLEKRINISTVSEIQTFADVIDKVSVGHPVIIIDKQQSGLSVGLEKYEQRSLEEPPAERVVRGPRHGFIETLQVNISLLRRRIKSPQLKTELLKVGRYSQTDVVVAYIEGIVDPTLVQEVTNRLKRIKVDAILDSQNIEEFIEDNPYSPFPQVLNTERVDVTCAYLLEGHVGVLVDGSPFALIAPTTFYSLLQSAEDYYERFMIGTALRWLRYFFVVLALLLPSMYVAVLSFHQEMVPETLLLSMAASREVVPFPALVEAFIMEVIFEVLREAGIRLPMQIGAAVSIVGGLIIGEAAVRAGIVSSPMVIVVALTGIANFAFPRFNAAFAIRLLRFPLLLLAGTLGLLGVMLGVVTLVIHLCTLRSFGLPYLAPMAPVDVRSIKDVLLRAPAWASDTRPRLTGQANKKRQAHDQKPGPSRGGE